MLATFSTAKLQAKVPLNSSESGSPSPTRADLLKEKVQEALEDAKRACEDPKSKDCVISLDTVEELSASLSRQKAQQKAAAPGDLDPQDGGLNELCKEHPESFECKVFDD